MPDRIEPVRRRPSWAYLNPLHATFLAATLPLALGAAIADWAYAGTHEVQWSNFAAWLIAGVLVFAVPAWLCSVVFWLRDRNAERTARGGRELALMLALLALCVAALLGALMHAKDAWAMMPGGFVCSVLAACLSVVAIGFGLFFVDTTEARP